MSLRPTQLERRETTPLFGVSSRAAGIAVALKRFAANARATGSKTSIFRAGGVTRRSDLIFARGVLISLVLFVVLPIALSGLYLGLIASKQYVSEVRFAVRGAERPTVDSLASLTGLQSLANFQDSQIVVEYIESRGMVEAIDRKLDLRKIYSISSVDYLSRFNPKEPIEELVYYWHNRVNASIDSQSGIITVIVRAFTPQDAYNLAEEIIRLSEKLVNTLSERTRGDALRQARDELRRAETRLQQNLVAMKNLRNSEGLLDANKAGEAMSKMIGELRLELIHMQQEYNVQKQSIAPTSPQLRVLSARIDAMRGQIAQLESQMTGGSAQSSPALSDSIGRFDRENMEKKIAQEQYIAASAAYERARVELETQPLYLTTFLLPTVAQQALYPRRLLTWSAIALACLFLWSGGFSLAVLARNHLAA